jgi:hypothetical protein
MGDHIERDDNTILEQYYAGLAAIEEDDRPSSIIDCVEEDGTIDTEKYYDMLKKEEELEKAEALWFEYVMNEEEKVPASTKRKRTHSQSVKTLRPYYFDNNGELVYLHPQQTFWYLVYVRKPPLKDSHFHVKFCRRFRMPYGSYQGLLDCLEDLPAFSRWYRNDAVGQSASPIELLLLGALRYLGRGLTFDDLEEYTAQQIVLSICLVNTNFGLVDYSVVVSAQTLLMLLCGSAVTI